MEKQFVTYEIALKLKELGFDEPCLAYFESVYDGLTQKHAGRLVLGNKPEHLQSYKQLIYIFGQNNQLAPLWQQVIDWLREKHSILIYPHFCEDGVFFLCVRKGTFIKDSLSQIMPLFDDSSRLETLKHDYHDSLIKAIKEALKLI